MKKKKVKLGEILSITKFQTFFFSKVMISFRTNIVQKVFIVVQTSFHSDYKLLPAVSHKVGFICRAFVGSFRSELLLAVISFPARQGCSAQFLLHTTGCAILLLLTRYILHQVLGAHVILCLLVFFILLPFWVRILQDHEECFSYGHQTDSGASGPRPVPFLLSMKSWMFLVEASFSRLARWIFAHWIYQLILIEMIYTLLLIVTWMSCGGREGSCSNDRNIYLGRKYTMNPVQRGMDSRFRMKLGEILRVPSWRTFLPCSGRGDKGSDVIVPWSSLLLSQGELHSSWKGAQVAMAESVTWDKIVGIAAVSGLPW